MKTKVFITVDTEFTIAGTFANHLYNRPTSLQAIFCEKNGQSHGLGFILDTLNQYQLKATFFVEALNKHYFGYELMGKVVETLNTNHQDIQLHLHPCWQYFKNPDWKNQLSITPPNDDITQRSYTEIQSIIGEGIEIFAGWGLPYPNAIRTGGLIVKNDVYKAMSSFNINFSSNIGVAIYKPREPALNLYSGCHILEGCYELPVLTYSDVTISSKNHLKLLTITGSSWEEIKILLESAVANKVSHVVILTHPFEFVKNQNQQYTDFNINKINQSRFIKLCSYLQEQKDHFETMTFSELKTADVVGTGSENTLLKVPMLSAFKRLLENQVNNYIKAS